MADFPFREEPTLVLDASRWQWAMVQMHRFFSNRAFARKEYGKALRHAEASLRISPNHVRLLFTLGILRGYAGDMQGAIDAMGKVLVQEPQNEEALAATGNAYSHLDDLPAAVRFYSRAIDLRGDFGRAFLGRGIALHQLGQAALAAEDFARCIDLGHNIPVARAFRSASLLKQGLPDEAFQEANVALSLPPDDPRVMEVAAGVCGDVLLARGEYRAATNEYFRAIEASGTVYPDQIVKIGKASLLGLTPGSGIWVVEHLTGIPFESSFMNWLSRQGLVLAWESPDPVRAEQLLQRIVEAIARGRVDEWVGYDEEVASLFQREGLSFAPFSDMVNDIPGPLGKGRKGRVLLVSPPDDVGKVSWEASFAHGFDVRILQTIRGAIGVMEQVSKGDVAIVVATSTGMRLRQMEDLVLCLRGSEYAASMLVILDVYSEVLARQLTSQGVAQVLRYPHDMPTLGHALERAFEDAVGRKGKILATDDREAFSTARRKILIGANWILFGFVAIIAALKYSDSGRASSLISFGFIIYGILKIAEGMDLKARRTRPGEGSAEAEDNLTSVRVKCQHCGELLELDDEEVLQKRFVCPECGKEGKL